MTAVMDKTHKRASAIQAARLAKIVAMLQVLKFGVPDQPAERQVPTWPHPATVEAMEDGAWDALAQLASQVDGVRHGTPSDETRRQLLTIYRVDYARHMAELARDEESDPFTRILDDLG